MQNLNIYLSSTNYIGLHVWTLALGGMLHRDKIRIFALQG